MPSAAVKRYWEWLPRTCVVCGAEAVIHHIMHVNFQRISKDDMLVAPLCPAHHNMGKDSVHLLGGERQFLAHHGIDLVQWAVLNRHNYEVGR